MHTTMREVPPRLAIFGLAIIALIGCGQQRGETAAGLVIEDAWARATGMPMQMEDEGGHAGHAGRNSAVYMSLRNDGRVADRLLLAESDVAAAVEIHRTQVEEGVMRMRPVEGGLTVAPGESVELRPGGLHVMLLGLTRPLLPGDRLVIRLHFERAGVVEAEAEVRER